MLPPDVQALALAHRTRQQRLAGLAVTTLRRSWGLVDPAAPLASWDRLASSQAVILLTAAQLEAARGADDYSAAAVTAWGETPDPAGAVRPRAFAGIASDGRTLDTLLRQPAVEVEMLVSGGMPVADALGVGLTRLGRIVATQVADAARIATGVALTNDRRCTGYVRQLNPPSCSRCVLLAGKEYKTNAGFQRHPHCDCVHVPTVLGSRAARTPREIFDEMADPQMRRAGWSVADIRAIRDGADIAQVTNARRGLSSMTVAGRRIQTTREGITRRGLAGQRLGARTGRVVRLTPEAIYAESVRLGWSREETIRQLTRHGYII